MAQRFLSNIRINDAYTFPASDGTSGQVISTDGAGNLSFIDVESEAGATVIYKDNFSGDDSTVTFTLANVVSDEVITQVYIDGVYQNKDTYITSGDQITFSSAPPNGVEIEIISFNTVSTQGIIAYNAKNSTGSTIAAGTAVRAVGTDGNSGHILIAPMIADGSVEPKYFMGITADEVLNGEYVDVVHFGVVGKINTNSFTDGDVLWLDPANDGGFTVTEPNAPNIKMASAIVLNASTNGKIFVRVQGNEGLHELHDVHIENLADKDLLVYNTTQGYWENSKTLGDITTGNITTDGTVDGVDISTFKADYDSHTHTESEITDFGNYVTGVTHDEVNTKLVVTTRDGLTQDLDISQYIDDTNLAYIQSGTLDGATGIATFTRDDATSFTVDLSALLDDTDTNDYLTGASFETTDGVLTLTVQNQDDVTVDLDGRYQLSSDAITTSNISSQSVDNADKLDGIHADGFIRDLGDTVTVSDYNSLPEGIVGTTNTSATNIPYGNHNITITLENDASAGRKAQLFFGDEPGGGMRFRLRQGDTLGWHDWARLWSSYDFTSTNISNWNTAYGWGDHAGLYLPISGKAADSELLDGLDSTQFVKQLSDASSPDYTTPSSRRVNPNASNPTNEHYAVTTFGNNGNVTGQLATHFVSGLPYTRGYNSGWSTWKKIWTDANDGSGSGLDADLLDGLQGSQYLRSDTSDTLSGTLTVTGQLKIGTVGSQNWISFAGTTGDGGGSTTYTTTYIGERIYSGTEQAELIIYKGNDYASASGPDRIRMIAANHCFDVYATSQSYPTDLNGVGALSTTRAMTIYNTGYIQTDHSFRAPIFYDSDNTNRYLDPLSTSVLGFASFEGDNTSYNSRTSTGVSVGRYTSEYAYIELGSTNANGGWIDFSSANGTDYNGRIRYWNTAEEFTFDTDGSTRLYLNSDYLYHTSDMRSPIFYDSNDTNYYVNPNSTGWSSYNAGGARFRNIEISPNSYGDTIQNENAGGNLWLQYSHNGPVGLGYGGGLTTAYNGLTVEGTAARLNEGLRLPDTDGAVNSMWGIYGWRTQLQFTKRNISTDGYEGTGMYIEYNGLYVQSDYSFRSPVFYDSADTGYYVDPNGNSILAGVQVRTNGLIVNRNYSNSALWFATTIDNNHALWNDYAGGPGSRGAAGSGFDGIKWNTYRGIHIRGGLAGAYNCIVVTNSSGSTNDHKVSLYAHDVKQFGTENGYALATNQMRSPIFYDSNNTARYVDPASTSVLSATDFKGTVSLSSNELRLVSLTDGNHYLKKISTGYSGSTIDGPQLQGHQGGELTTNLGGNNWALRWGVGGNVYINNSLSINKTSQYGEAVNLTYSGSNSSAMLIRNNTGATATAISFFYSSAPQGARGSITVSSTSTAYNTSSDYRLKENVVPMTGSLDRVDQLKPSRFNFIGDDKVVDGFLAHEAQEIVPEAVTGVKDGLDDEGNPEYQGIDQAKLVPLLVGAIQELKAEVEALKQQLNGIN